MGDIQRLSGAVRYPIGRMILPIDFDVYLQLVWSGFPATFFLI
jgi:hypothetical protein